MSRLDPSDDADRYDMDPLDQGDRTEAPAFACSWCNNIETDDTHWPFCSSACAAASENEDASDDMGEIAGRVASPAKG